MPQHLLSRILPQSHSHSQPSTKPKPKPKPKPWYRLDPYPSTRLPHPRPLFTLHQRVHLRATYDPGSKLQQQSLWISGWRWDADADPSNSTSTPTSGEEKGQGTGTGTGKAKGKGKKERGGGGEMRYLLSYTPNGSVYYGSEVEEGLLGA